MPDCLLMMICASSVSSALVLVPWMIKRGRGVSKLPIDDQHAAEFDELELILPPPSNVVSAEGVVREVPTLRAVKERVGSVSYSLYKMAHSGGTKPE